MSLPVFGNDRIGYDVDWTVLRHYVMGSTAWTAVPQAQVEAMNNEEEDTGYALPVNNALVLLFPQPRWMHGSFLVGTFAGATANLEVQYSTDTTNGVNKTWHHLTYLTPNPSGVTAVVGANPMSPNYRNFVVAWPTAAVVKAKAIRIIGAGSTFTVKAFHLYGDTPNETIQLYTDRHAGDVPVGGAVALGKVTVNNHMTIAQKPSVYFNTLGAGNDAIGACCYVSMNGVDWAGIQTPTIPAKSSASVYVMLVLPRSLANKPYVARIYAKVIGQPPGVTYIWVDSVTPRDDPDALIVDVTPTDVVVAGETQLTVRMVGAGATQAEHNAEIKYSGEPSVDPTILSWNQVPASANATTGERLLSPNSGVVDAEHQEVVLTLPATAQATEGELQLYFNGTEVTYSSQTLWPLANDPLPGGGSASNEAAAFGAFRHRGNEGIYREPWPIQDDWPVDLPADVVPSAHPQWMVQLTPKPYVVRSGVPMAPPKLGAVAQSVAYSRVPVISEGLATAESYGTFGAPGWGCDARWLPNPADIRLRSDVGSDVSGWQPHFNPGLELDFAYHADSAPYIDPNYTYYASGERVRTDAAMIFPGGAWMQYLGQRLTYDVAEFAWIIVAVLHFPPTTSWYDILATPTSAADPIRGTDCTLRYDNGQIKAYTGARYSTYDLHLPIYKGRGRPVIIGWSEGFNAGSLYVVDALGIHSHDWWHKQRPSFDARFWLGTTGGTVGSVANSAVMDVLDIMYFARRVHAKGFASICSQLNNIYGVVGR